tara:strand:+ start:2910 stop:3038 length:129 start_codon:yes stop_codon:yes gene_type:complete
MTENIKSRVNGRSPFTTCLSPSPLKERGTKGERLINKFYELA